MSARGLLLSLLGLSIALSLKAADIDITKFGAIGDGKTLNSSFIQNAIDECSRSGGGKVIFPEGRFLSGTIILKDNSKNKIPGIKKEIVVSAGAINEGSALR
jgi:polygalacturonase